MAARNRSERSIEENVFSLENTETVNTDEGYNQEETELSVSLLTEIGTNADQNEIEIIEYNVSSDTPHSGDQRMPTSNVTIGARGAG